MNADLLTVFISNEWHKDKPVKQRAIALSKTAKKMRDKTKDKELYEALRSTINAVSNGRYQDAINAIYGSERVYFERCML